MDSIGLEDWLGLWNSHCHKPLSRKRVEYLDWSLGESGIFRIFGYT